MRTSELRLRVAHLVSALAGMSAFACLQLFVFSDAILRAWVGPSFLVGNRVVQIVILAVPFYFIYAGLRGAIDAAAVTAYNTRNILFSGAILLALIVLITAITPHDRLLEGFACSIVVGLAVLAFCTLRTARYLFQFDFKLVEILPGLVLAILLGLLSLFLHGWLVPQPNLFELLVYETLLMGIYFLLLWLSRATWLRFVFAMIFQRVPVSNEVV
jgi:O-antigen/teichoic acid export membrane protein